MLVQILMFQREGNNQILASPHSAPGERIVHCVDRALPLSVPQCVARQTYN